MPPTVAIVGRPNVGKSTLFNRMTRRRRALTHDLPGVTRDRVAADAQRPSGGVVVLVDTGGFEPESEAEIPALIRKQALVAIEAADAVVLVVDGSLGVVGADEALGTQLRRIGRPVVLAVNKLDRSDAAFGLADFARLGFDTVEISAEHGRGIGELWEQLEAVLPKAEEDEAAGDAERELSVAIVGRPNVGKSSLLNALLGEERVLVSDVPGTTRDTVDTLLEVKGRAVRLLDTAGIRRRRSTERGPEVLSVVVARKAIERAQVCLIILDAGDGPTAQDAHVAGYVSEAGRGAVVVANKADLLPPGTAARTQLERRVRESLKFLHDAPLLLASAVQGGGLERLLPTAVDVGHAFRQRIPTGELNRVLRNAWESHPPPGGKRTPRLYYAAQFGVAPPKIALVTSTKELHFSYMRYLENVVREAFPLAGVPLRFIMRGRQGRG